MANVVAVIMSLGRGALGALLAWRVWCEPSVLGVALVVSEGIAVALTLRNLAACSSDDSTRGALVAGSYVAGALFRPEAVASVGAVALGLVTVGVLIGLSLYLHRSYSAACPVFSGAIRDTGPYAMVRHPMAAVHLLSRFAIAASWPSTWNAVAFGICVVLGVAGAVMEERFLEDATEEYGRYRKRVPWRFLPGLC